MEIQCFLLSRTDYVRRSLRRYVSVLGRSCEPPLSPNDDVNGFCDESAIIEEKLYKPKIGRYETSPDVSEFASHPLWPTHCCRCGQPFQFADNWQVNDDRLWINTDLGICTSINKPSEVPVGAMWFGEWMGDVGSTQWKQRGGGDHLFVKTPGGIWDTDCGAQLNLTGDGWERFGDAPNVTANPSILIPGKYHGWLRNGRLIDA